MEKKSVISIKKSSFKFIAKSNTTLLDAALKENINLPHGCKSGACGSCIANVIEGNIKNKGPETTTISNTILLCQSYAASKKIVLEISWYQIIFLVRGKYLIISLFELFIFFEQIINLSWIFENASIRVI